MVGHTMRQMDSRSFLENWTTIGASSFCQCTSFFVNFTASGLPTLCHATFVPPRSLASKAVYFRTGKPIAKGLDIFTLMVPWEQSGWTSQRFQVWRVPLPTTLYQKYPPSKCFRWRRELVNLDIWKKNTDPQPKDIYSKKHLTSNLCALFAKKNFWKCPQIQQEIPPDDCSVSHVFGVRSLWKKCCWNWVPVQALQAVPQLFLWSHAGQKLIWRYFDML